MQNIQSKVDAARLQRPWSLAHRRQHLAEDQALHQHNQSAKEQGSPQRFFWRSLYLPQQGMFCQAPKDLQFGTRQKVCATPTSKAPLEVVRQRTLWQCLVSLLSNSIAFASEAALVMAMLLTVQLPTTDLTVQYE